LLVVIIALLLAACVSYPPKPRQFSYLLSTVFLAGSALSFYYGLAVLGFILGGMVVIGGAILSTTLWCLGLWWYRLILGQAPAE